MGQPEVLEVDEWQEKLQGSGDERRKTAQESRDCPTVGLGHFASTVPVTHWNSFS